MGNCFNSWRLRWRRRYGAGATPCTSCWSWCRSSCPASCGSAKAVRIGCTKSYLVVLNFMFLICGSTVLGLGCWMHIERQAFIYVELLQNIPSTGLLVLFDRLPAVFIVIGGSVAILSFLGCCGACADSAFFLCLYTFLLCLILITEVIIAILIIAFREQILLKVESSLKYQIRNEYNKSGTPSNLTTIDTDHVTVLLDAMQKKLKCCGSSGPEDYRHSAWYNFSKTKYEMFVPMSCCSTVFNDSKGQTIFKDENKCQIEAVLYIYANHQEKREMARDSLNTQGCNRSVVNWFNSNMFILVSIVCIVITLQILDLSSACVLMSLVIQKHSDCRWAEEAGTEIG